MEYKYYTLTFVINTMTNRVILAPSKKFDGNLNGIGQSVDYNIAISLADNEFNEHYTRGEYKKLSGFDISTLPTPVKFAEVIGSDYVVIVNKVMCGDTLESFTAFENVFYKSLQIDIEDLDLDDCAPLVTALVQLALQGGNYIIKYGTSH